MSIVAPSLLAANFLNLQEAVQLVENSEADYYHLDVMDGLFVPNISYGFPIMDALKKVVKKPMDVHLMIVQPERYIERFIQSGAASISVHYEACDHLHSVVHQIKKGGAKAGVAINPHTSVHLLKDILQDIDFVNLMSVNPGFGGQQFIENTYHKIQELKALQKELGTEVKIEIDGGVTTRNASKLIQTGADILVAGSSIFGSDDPQKAITELKNA